MTNLTSVGITAGVPTSGTGTVSTIDALMADGGQATLGTTTGIAVTTDATGTLQQYLRGLVKLVAAGLSVTIANATLAVTQSGSWVIAAGSAIIGKVEMLDGSGNALSSTTGSLNVNITGGGGTGGTAAADEATFTEGTTNYTPIGGVFKTSQTALTSGQGGAVALSASREMYGIHKVWDGTNTAAVKAASTAPVVGDPALVVAISPNSVNANGATVSASSAPVVPATDWVGTTALSKFGTGYYETVAASQTAQVLQSSTGTTGDYISGVLVIPATTSPGNVLLLDNATSMTIFTGGASSVTNLVPFFIPLGAVSRSGAWKLTTGANVSCIAIGKFS